MHKIFPKYFYFIDKLNIEAIKNLNKKFAVIYRNYDQKPNIAEIIRFKEFCRKKQIKFLISNYFDIAIKHKLDGFYIPSFNKRFFLKINNYSNKFILAGSAHNRKEIKIKEKQNVDLIFLSPIFKTEKRNNYLGIIKFNNLSNFSKKPIIALGGLSNKNIKRLKMTNTIGIAGISHIKKLNF